MCCKKKNDNIIVNPYSMDDVLKLIENTVEKSSIDDFRGFITKHDCIRKWFLCSDYCLGDKRKPNDVISFVLYPYIFEFRKWKRKIDDLQKKDIKDSRHISEKFIEFSQSGNFFSFNFILDRKENIFEKWQNKELLISMVDQYIELMNKWKNNNPFKTEIYDELQHNLRRLRDDMKAKSYNTKLLKKALVIIFLASYIKYLLFREAKKIDVFGWISDRDSITSMSKGVYVDLYTIVSHNICANRLPERKYKNITDIIPSNISDEDEIRDSLIRIPDIICGIIADHNLMTNEVSKEKHLEGVEKVLADNHYITILKFHSKGLSRIVHHKEQIDDQRGKKA